MPGLRSEAEPRPAASGGSPRVGVGAAWFCGYRSTSRILRDIRPFADSKRRGYGRAALAAGGAALALRPDGLLSESCLAGLEGPEMLGLLDVLEAARAPYERADRAQQSTATRRSASSRGCTKTPPSHAGH